MAVSLFLSGFATKSVGGMIFLQGFVFGLSGAVVFLVSASSCHNVQIVDGNCADRIYIAYPVVYEEAGVDCRDYVVWRRGRRRRLVGRKSLTQA
jgi:hypothetical protein